MTKHPKRFYKTVSVAGSKGDFRILLDGKSASAGGRVPLIAPARELADAIAVEWDAQADEINLQMMPFTSLLSASLASGETSTFSHQEVLSYLGTDLLCYRAESPDELVAEQEKKWRPYLDWFSEYFGAELRVTTGIMKTEQPQILCDRVYDALNGLSAPEIFGIAKLTANTGSAVLGLASWEKAFGCDDIFDASRVDEKFQQRKWGVDPEAKARDDQIRIEFNIAYRFLELLTSDA